MAVAYVQSWSDNGGSTTASTTTLTISGATANNLLVAIVGIRANAGSASFTTPSGWTLLQEAVGDVSGATYYRVASGTTADNFAPSWGINKRWAVAAAEYSGLATSSVLDTSNENATQLADGTSTTITTGSVTPSTADAVAIAFGYQDKDGTATSVLSINSSFTKRVEEGDSSDLRPDVAIADLILTGTTAQNPTWSSSLATNTGMYAAIGVFLEPGGGGTSITIADLTQAQTIDNVTLTQAHTLAVNDATQAQTLDNVDLTQANVLSVDELGQGQTIDNLTLTQAHTLSVNELLQSQTLDNVTLTQAHIVAINDIDQAQSIDNLTLTLAGTVSPDPLTQAQLVDNITLTQANVLAVDELGQAQTVDGVTVSPEYTITLADLHQAQLLDNITLALSDVLDIADVAQAQTIDTTALTQHGVLSVSDLTQAQIIDIVTLGGLVVGELHGTVVVYALLDGEVTVTPLLTGSVTLH